MERGAGIELGPVGFGGGFRVWSSAPSERGGDEEEENEEEGGGGESQRLFAQHEQRR